MSDMSKGENNYPSTFERLMPIILVLSIAMAFMVGVLWQKVVNLEKGGTATTNTAANPAAAPAATTVSLDTIKGLWDKDIVKFGKKDAKLLFVEVGDPSCPFCHAASGKNKTIYSKLGGTSFQLKEDGGTYEAPVTEMRKLVDAGKASFAYIYYPGHGTGELGMKAMYCANEKGKFWEVHDILMSDAGYEFMDVTVKNDVAKAGQMGEFLKGAIDPNFIKTCLESGKYDKKLADDQAIAATLGVQGTPGFFVNETSYPGAYNFTDMKATVDAALK
jgi:protein-disulfide isomerase